MTANSKSKLAKIGIVAGIILVIVIALYSFFAGNYNKMVAMDENVSGAWSQVENVYQRRLDLVPNLVSTVKGYAKHEAEVLENVAQARSRAGGVTNIDSAVIDDPQKFEAYQKAQSELSSSLQRLLVVTENYPELKANQNFLMLQDELSGTENRIAVERKRYNDAAKEYNTFIRRFPQNLIANMNGFEKKQYFTASEEAKSAPKVEF